MMKLKSLAAGLVLAAMSLAPAFGQGVGQLGSGQMLANTSANPSRGQPTGASAYFDFVYGSTRGSILERGASGWVIKSPGASGLPWVSNGAGADPAYQVLTNPALPAPLSSANADSIIGNFTAGAAAPGQQALPNCANALIYSTSTHLIGCNVGGGTGTMTSVTPGAGLVSSTTASCSQSAITVSGTLSKAECVNAQSGTSYAIVDGDRAKLITASNAAAQAYTIAQAGASTTFQAGWYTDLTNNSTTAAGIVTITPATSTINGASTYVLKPGSSVRLVSDGTNYQVALPFFGAASKADEQAGTSAIVATTPSQQQSHPSSLKAWANFNGSAVNGAQTVNANYNVSGVSRSGLGTYTVSFTTAFATTPSYGCVITVLAGTHGWGEINSFATGSTVIDFANSNAGSVVLFDPASANIACFGGQ